MSTERFPISEYFNRINVFPSAALSEDGARLAFISSVTGSPQVWIGQVDPKGGLLSYPRPITFGKDEQPHVMDSALMWIGNDRLAILKDRHGDELTFIEIVNLADGQVQRVPENPGTRDYLGFLSTDKKTLYFTSNRGTPATQGLYAYTLKSSEVKKIVHDASRTSGWVGPKEWKGYLLFYQASETYANTLHGVNPKTGKTITLFDEPGTLMSPVGLLPKDRMLVVTNKGRQFSGLAYFNLKSKEVEYLGADKWDIDLAQLSPDKKSVIAVRNVAGRAQMEVYSFPSMKRRPLKFSSRGIVEGLSFAKNSRFAVFAYSSPTEPRNYYRLDMKSLSVQQLTDNYTSRVPQKQLVHPELIKFDSEGRTIYSWLFLPKGAKKTKSLPVMVWPHGGPQWQERAQFRPIFQYFVGRGFAVWAPNHTGSTGFGKDFVNAICGQWGTVDLPDMQNGVEWLKHSGWIDPKKIMIMGGSYGGYMTLRSITRLPDTFKAAVDIFGVSNLLTFVQSVPADWRVFMDRLVGHHERDAERLREQSPAFEIDRIRCPLLVIQGARDPRVVKAESDQIVEHLKAQGKPVEYLVFDDEGHGFLKLENELKAFTQAAEFLERWV